MIVCVGRKTIRAKRISKRCVWECMMKGRGERKGGKRLRGEGGGGWTKRAWHKQTDTETESDRQTKRKKGSHIERQAETDKQK